MSSQDDRAPGATPPRSRRIVVVDDNHDAAESLSMLLSIAGHEVFVAHDGPGALSVAADRRPDAMFVDIGLPGMDGFEVATRLRADATLRDLLLIALSGYGQEDDLERSARAGFDHHLVKPADLAALESVLTRGRANPAP